MSTLRRPTARAVGLLPGRPFPALTCILSALLAVCPNRIEAQTRTGSPVTPDMADLARRGVLRADTRQVSVLVDGAYRGVHVGRGHGFDVAWINGFTFSTGTMELDVRGKDVQSGSFLGLALGGVNDSTYETVYLRPFNFRTSDPRRRMHAVQYESMPTHPWSRLRSESPELYENPIDPAPDPDAWVHLRLLVEPTRLLVFAGEGAEPDLVVDRISAKREGRVGLWVGTSSDGDFANLRIIPDRAAR